jgi:tRNA-splicing ligase RtcB
MDDDWSVTAVTARMKDRAWSQLGTSGSGNHFVEFGELIVTDAALGLWRTWRGSIWRASPVSATGRRWS